MLGGVRKCPHLPLQVLLDSDVAQVMNNRERPRNLGGSTAVSHLYFACDFSFLGPQLEKYDVRQTTGLVFAASCRFDRMYIVQT